MKTYIFQERKGEGTIFYYHNDNHEVIREFYSDADIKEGSCPQGPEFKEVKSNWLATL